MARKAKTRRDQRPRLSQAQLEAYRNRPARPQPAEPSEPNPPAPAPSTLRVSSWGSVEEEFAMIRADLIRLGVITALMLAILAVLWVFLG